MRKADLTGRRFGKLTVLCEVETSKTGASRFLCRCECGREIEKDGSALTAKGVKSCKPCSKTKHNKYGTRLYMVWGAMIQRCTNPNNKGFANYGGRGISVCADWRNDFAQFHDWAMNNGYQEGLMIERVDNNAGYSPSNCVFVTRSEQNNNRRSCRMYEIDGLTMSIAQQAKRFGVNRSSVRRRANKGLTGRALVDGLPSTEQ